MINNETNVFRLIFRMPLILDNAYLNLDLEIKIVEIRSKLSETYYFEVELTKFYNPKFDDF